MIAVVRDALRDHPQLRQLAAAGARLLRQPPLIFPHGRIAKMRRALAAFSPECRALRQAFAAAEAPHVFIEQSATYDFLEESLLRGLIAETAASYDVVCHLNTPSAPFAESRRRDAVIFLSGARRVFFNSAWTRETTELQLLHRFTHAAHFSYPVRFPHDAPLPWPATSPLRLVALGRFDSQHKGLDALLRALPLLPPDLPAWTLDLIGHGPDASYLRELIVWLGLSDRVRLQPAVSDIPAVWRDAHLLVLTSRWEGLAVSMLEAMACGRPVLRTPYGGCAEWIVPNETGFVCAAAEPALIADSLTSALRGSARWPEIGRAAHRRIRTLLPPDPEAVFLEAFGFSPTSATRPTTTPAVPTAS